MPADGGGRNMNSPPRELHMLNDMAWRAVATRKDKMTGIDVEITPVASKSAAGRSLFKSTRVARLSL